MDESRLSVAVPPDGVADIDATAFQPVRSALSALRDGEVVALRVRNLVSREVCDHLSARLADSESVVDHRDVAGLRVIGLSHFQVARDPHLRHRYTEEARSLAGALRGLSSPFASPFDSAIGFLLQAWPAGCRVPTLPTEGPLSPFTIRVYGEGVGIEAHQDILSAESPADPDAASLADQFGANIYLSMSTEGGALEIFSTAESATGYQALSGGPHVVPRARLSQPAARIQPNVGDLVIFSTRRVHSVEPSGGTVPRVTISFFIGVQNEQSPLWVWA